MSRVLFRRLTALTTFAALLFSPSLGRGQQPEGQNQPITRAQLVQQSLKAMSANVRSVARILEAEGVAIEAELLFTVAGDLLVTQDVRNKLREQLDKLPLLQSSRIYSDPLRGVVMADTLTLVENLPIEADTVIIAKHVIFNGHAPMITGGHDIHLFALESIKAERGRETVITIDSSGAPGADGVEGSPNTRTAANGVNGVDGETGSCAGKRTGGSGTEGSDGQAGESGGNGTNGKDGTDSHNQTITVPNDDAPFFQIVANGGAGGRGGSGGQAGSGGRGGNGGAGGNGVGCRQNAYNVGEGGPGGAGGTGGSGGTGGQGGNGGNGGKSGHVVAFFPPFEYDSSRIRSFAHAGSGGLGGRGGMGGSGGQAGQQGRGGSGGAFAACIGRHGAHGLVGQPGAPGSAGQNGSPGQPGDPGSLTLTPSRPMSKETLSRTL